MALPPPGPMGPLGPPASAPARRGEVDDLRASLCAARGSIQHLTNVLEGEQARTTALEAAAVKDRARIEDLAQGLREAKSRDDQQLRAIHDAHKELAALGARMRAAWERLDAHSGDHGAAGARLSTLHDGQGTACRRIDALEELAVQLRADLDGAASQAGQHASELEGLGGTVQRLQTRADEAADGLQRLGGEHAATADKLRESLDSIVHPGVEQAARERARLDDADARLRCLDAQHAATCDGVADLRGRSDGHAQDVQALRQQVEGLGGSCRDLAGALSGAAAEAKAHGERLDDALRDLEQLGEASRETCALVRKVRAEAAEAQAATAEQAAMGTKLAHQLEVLRHGLEVAEGEVQDLRVFLQVPRDAAY